ncbi:replicative DNA helicase [Helicobacter fennelliae]|uniref:Replicative DNA helicase n=2 Tax=Helicobacter TaxID=209 RepID=T1DX00_9HELI|nr:replicative DNA helicase [Helicobacter fennelliae]GAD19847.1 replicative DNA helicase [Helicobacter fennelliae MRY12-0050]STP07964.1 replicative DNA helicase [Helicobacter fennelliae]
MEDFNTYIANMEKSVISSIIFDPSGFDDISDQLQVGDFLYPAHRHIFDICKELHTQNLPITPDFIASRLVGKRSVSQEEFTQILSVSPIANIEAFIKEIKNASIKRELAKLANMMREKSFDTTLTSESILDEIEQKVFEISSTKSTQTDFLTSREIIELTLENIKILKERGNNILTGLATGFEDLDRMTTGFNKGELIIIGARPSMGKTAFFLNMIQTILNKNQGVAVFSLEMPSTHLMLRMLSASTSIPLQDLRIGRLDDVQMERLSVATDTMTTKPLYIDDGSSLTILQLRSKLRKLKSQDPNLEIAVIDYLQLMSGGNESKGAIGKERHSVIQEISRGLKTLARELNIPIIALSQLNRVVETRDDKRPMLSDLRESGSIEQDADVILFLYRDDIYRKRADKDKIAKLKRDGKENEAKKLEKEMYEQDKRNKIEPAEIIVAKNRNGEIGTIRIQFNKPYTRFEERIRNDEKDYTPTNTKLDSADSPTIQIVQL